MAETGRGGEMPGGGDMSGIGPARAEDTVAMAGEAAMEEKVEVS